MRTNGRKSGARNVLKKLAAYRLFIGSAFEGVG